MAAIAQLENGSRQFLFLNLPPEVQDVVVNHLHSADLLRFQQVSRHCHQIASRRVWKSLSFYLENPNSDALARKGKAGLKSRESKFMEALQTLVCSDYDYAQHIRSFVLRGYLSGDHSSHNVQLFQLRYLPGSPAQQAISITLLALLHKAPNLERFALQAPLGLSEAVWQRLVALKSLSSLEVSMHGHYKPVHDPRYSHLLPEPFPHSPDVEAGLPYRHIANCSHLQTLVLTHINESKHIDHFATCVKRCLSTLSEIQLSISEEWYDEARTPIVVHASAQTPAQIDPLLLDDPDDVSMLSEEEMQPVVSHVATQAEKDSIRSNRTAQEALLAQIFSLESGNRCEKILKKALRPTGDTRPKKSVAIDDSTVSKMQEVIPRFLKGEKLDSNETEMIDKLRSQLNQVSKSRKKAKVKQSPHPNSNKASQHSLISTLNQTIPNPTTYYTYKPVGSLVYGTNHPYPPPLAKPTASQIYGAPSPYLSPTGHHVNQFHYLTNHKNPYAHPGTTASASPASLGMQNFGSSSQKPGNSLFSSTASKLHTVHNDFLAIAGGHINQPSLLTNAATNANHLSSNQLAEVLEFTPLSHADPSASSSSVDEFIVSPKSTSANTDQNGIEHDTTYEDMNIDIEHPDEISGESGEDQESEDEPDVPLKVVVEKSKTKGKDKEGAVVRPVSPSKRARTVDSEPQSIEETVRRWVTESHGLALKRFSLYLIPLKASVLARALQVRLLQEIVLLGVGGQGPFWQMMTRASKEGALQLKSIQTDDVSKAFTECLLHLKSVEVLILRKRSKKDKFNTTTKEVVSISEIRRAMRPHVSSLRVLAIQNDEDGSWNLTDDLISLLKLYAQNLQELSFKLALQNINSLLLPLLQIGNMPKLRAIHLLNARQDLPASVQGMLNGAPGSAASTLAHTLYNSYSSSIACLVKDCVRSRKVAGDRVLRHVGLEDQFFSVSEEAKLPPYPDWLVEDHQEHSPLEPAEVSLDELARKIGLKIEPKVAFKSISLGSLERRYKIFSSQVTRARIG